MVVFVDLEADDDEPGRLDLPHPYQQRLLQQAERLAIDESSNDRQRDVSSPEQPQDEQALRNGFLLASALACFPIALSLAAQLDLNDLSALSETCHQVHGSITPFAPYLRCHSLRCANDQKSASSRDLCVEEKEEEEEEEEAETRTWTQVVEQDVALTDAVVSITLPFQPETRQTYGMRTALGFSARSSQCARDMVTPCRKCGIVVCRNCAIKPPSDKRLPGRFRRLCKTCLDAPLSQHLKQLREDHDYHDSLPASSASSTGSARSVISDSGESLTEIDDLMSADGRFSTPAFLRDPCRCAARGVFLCQPCGQNLCAGDTTYKRVWTWRSRYSTHIGGGLGTGLGQGEQGQKCGRGEHCLEKGAAGVCWVEIECSEARSRAPRRDDWLALSGNDALLGLEREHELSRNKPGYLSQEMEGIGGVVKKKVKKRIKVGATVYEYDNERESGKYLERESNGDVRSWCGWCFRVCPEQSEGEELERQLCSPP